MDTEKIHTIVLDSLAAVTPNVDVAGLDPDVHFRDQFDFDSVDQLNFVAQLEHRLTIKISELKYPQFASINSCVRQLAMAHDQA